MEREAKRQELHQNLSYCTNHLFFTFRVSKGVSAETIKKIVLNSYFLTTQDSQKTEEDDEVSQDIRIKRYILRHKWLIVIPRILREAIVNSKTNPRPKVEHIKRVMVEMVTKGHGAYVERTVTGFIKKFPLDVEKLRDLIAAEEYKQNCQRR